MASHEAEFQKKWAKVIAKAWSDPAFKKKLMHHPNETLMAEGLGLPKGVHVEIHESTSKVVHLNLPQRPEGEVSEETLLQIAAGATAGGCACWGH